MNPSRRMLRMEIKAGSRWPTESPRMREKVPATSPFQATMVNGSLAEMLRVKLLSTPQSTQASNTPRAPTENPNPPAKLVERKMLASVITKIAVSARRLIDSRKKNSAIKVVPTPSKFNSREAVEGGVFRRLIIRKIGGANPPGMIPPARHLTSGALMPASFWFELRRWE